MRLANAVVLSLKQRVMQLDLGKPLMLSAGWKSASKKGGHHTSTALFSKV